MSNQPPKAEITVGKFVLASEGRHSMTAFQHIADRFWGARVRLEMTLTNHSGSLRIVAMMVIWHVVVRDRDVYVSNSETDVQTRERGASYVAC